MAEDAGMGEVFWRNQWLQLLELATEVTVSATEVVKAMTGDLGPDIKTRDQAIPEIKRRIENYYEAQTAMQEYAGVWEKHLSQPETTEKTA